ncbi:MULTISPECIES: hypothetical protein [Haloprofundus]|nr:MULTISPECIES: hypothetical protein [Haloprofundus]
MRGQHTGRNYLGMELDGWPATELLDDELLERGYLADGGRRSDAGLSE